MFGSFQVMPLLKILYHAQDKNSHHIYMALIILLVLSEDDVFNKAVHEIVSLSSFLFLSLQKISFLLQHVCCLMFSAIESSFILQFANIKQDKPNQIINKIFISAP